MKNYYSEAAHDYIENDKSDLIIGLLLGTAIGACAAILFAPKSGKETRKQITDIAKGQKDLLKDAKDKAGNLADEAKDKLESAADYADEKVDEVAGEAKGKWNEAADEAEKTADKVKRHF